MSGADAVRGALRARRWMLDLFGGGPEGDPAPPPELSRAAWALALRTERCASPLYERLASGERLEGLPADLRATLEAVRLPEAQKALSGLAQLRWLAGLAGRLGSRVVVLKGGAHLLAGTTVDLMDVDLLVEREALPGFVEAVDREGGYQRAPEGEGRDDFTGNHWAPRFLPGAIPLEIHFRAWGIPDAAAAISRSVPIPGAPGLYRLGAEDHLFHLLHHSVVQHVFARGRIRDLLLVGEAARACSAAGREAVLRGFAEAPQREAATRALRMGVAFAAGGAIEDPFDRIAAVRCLCAVGAGGGREWTRGRDTARHSALLLLEGPLRYVEYLGVLARPDSFVSTSPAVRRLERWSRPAARLCLAGVRVASALAALPAALRLARRAERLSAEVG